MFSSYRCHPFAAAAAAAEAAAGAVAEAGAGAGAAAANILEYNDGIIVPRLIYVSGRRSLSAWRRMK